MPGVSGSDSFTPTCKRIERDKGGELPRYELFGQEENDVQASNKEPEAAHPQYQSTLHVLLHDSASFHSAADLFSSLSQRKRNGHGA